MTQATIDFDRLLKVRLIVARFGEMDLAKWWNTRGQPGRLGTAAVRRGFPRTHHFAQARSVFAVAAHRCNEIFDPPDSVTLWRLTATAGREMQRRILSSLGVEDATVFVRDVDRPNIVLLRWACRQEQRGQEIAKLLRLRELHEQKAMVFVPSVRVGEELKQALAALGVDIPLYHSRVGTAWERQELAKRFLGQSKPAC